MTVTIEGPHHGAVTLEPGEILPIGREQLRGAIGVGDSSVSGHHGDIIAAEGSWSVRSTGSIYSFVVYDKRTPSRLFIPRGVGPVQVPFPTALLAIEIAQRRHTLHITGPSPDGWDDGWSSILRTQAADRTQMARRGTRLAREHEEITWRYRGDELRWFQVLVAFCAPRLVPPFSDRVPRYSEVARRLGMARTDKIADVYVPEIRRQIGLGDTDRVIEEAVIVAVAQQLVTVDDLELLDRFHPLPP